MVDVEGCFPHDVEHGETGRERVYAKLAENGYKGWR